MTLKLNLPSSNTNVISAGKRAELVRDYGEAYAANYEIDARRERARCQFITQSPAARGREAAAFVIAFETDMAPEAAVKLLTALPSTAGSNASAALGTAAAASWNDVVASLSAGAKH
jgi:hypothetical protein